MSKLDLKQAGALAAAATLGLGSVFGLAACKPSQDDAPTAERSYDMSRYLQNEILVNAEGERSEIIVMTQEAHDAYRAEAPPTYADMPELGPTLAEDLQTTLQSRWQIAPERLASLSHSVDERSRRRAPGALSIDQDGELLARYETSDVSKYCIIVNESNDMNMVLVADNPVPHRAAADIVVYENEIKDFISLHERAHCMGADEPQADFVAAVFLLRQHDDPARALGALETLQSFRYMNDAMLGVNGHAHAHAGLSGAIAQAVQMHAAGEFDGMTDEEIWSMAKSRQEPNTQATADGQRLQRACPTAYASSDYASLATCAGRLAERATGPARESYERLQTMLSITAARYESAPEVAAAPAARQPSAATRRAGV